jgi:hypothetical protein
MCERRRSPLPSQSTTSGRIAREDIREPGKDENDVTNGSQPTAPAYAENQDRNHDPSRVASAQRAIVALTEILENSVDLLGATLREEAARIPGRLMHPAAGFLSAAVGASFLTAAAALYLRELFGGWPLSFLALGALYLLAAVVVWSPGPDRK